LVKTVHEQGDYLMFDSEVAVVNVLDCITMNTSMAERRKLQELGCVHVTGLVTTSTEGTRSKPLGHEKRDLGRHSLERRLGADQKLTHQLAYARTMTIVTAGGEVWACYPPSQDIFNAREFELRDLLRRLCPMGGDGFDHFSNGERLNFEEVMRRMANPNYIPK
jgi:hypothetical protein